MLTATWDGASVVLLFKSDEGGQQVRYRPAGGVLAGPLVEKTLLVDKLDAKLEWEMRYLRP